MKRKVIIIACILLMITALIINNFNKASAANVLGPSTGLSCTELAPGDGGKMTKTCTLKLELIENASFNTIHVWFSTLENLTIKSVSYYDGWFFRELEDDDVTYVIQSAKSSHSIGTINVASFVLEKIDNSANCEARVSLSVKNESSSCVHSGDYYFDRGGNQTDLAG